MDPSSILGQYWKYVQPFYDTGLSDFQQSSKLSNQLTQDPTAWYNNIMQQYQMSPGAQEQSKYLTQQVQNSAAKGGYVGTPNEQVAMGGQLQRLMGQDQQQYYQNVMAPFQMGYSGLQHGGDTGFGATKEIGDLLSNQASLGAYGQAQSEGLNATMAGMGMGGLAKMLPWLLKAMGTGAAA